MKPITFRRFVLGLIAAPLSLALAACGSGADGDKTASGEPIARIAPPAGKSWTDVVATTPEGGYRMGNPDAPIKLIEYGSLTCPHCAHFAEESGAELRDNFVGSGRVSFEFRNLVMNPIDLTMVMLTRCGAPESYFALTEQVFANQAPILDNWQKLDEAAIKQAANQPADRRGIAIAELAGLTDFFAARGIAKEQAASCLANSASADALIKANQEQSKEFDIQGTPTFLINGQKVEMNAWPELKARLEQLGAR